MIISEKQIMQLIDFLTMMLGKEEISPLCRASAAMLLLNIANQQSEELKVIE